MGTLGWNRKPTSIECAVAFLHKAIGSIEGADWHEVADKLSRIGAGEFEDYKP
ncbi:MAG: hypothetical protein J0J05_12455 [Microbacterium sp.]|uniref:Imm8 family immunity protein n=1 Tax=Microbacterium sp. TaxID=51671 RepID=UPI001ACF1398|nr:hypothetical protein [Microbacterium sp.]